MKSAEILRSFEEDKKFSGKFKDFTKDFVDLDENLDLKNIVYRDTSEKKGWFFEKSEVITKVEKANLMTGDYTIKGFEKDFVIERKGSTAEFAHNIFEKRFEDEMKRLEEFKLPFLVCEFSFDDLLQFPINSGIPAKLWPKVKVRSKFLLSAFMRYQVIYKTRFILAGDNGEQVAENLFKMVMKYG